MRNCLRSLVVASLLTSLFAIAAPTSRVSALDPLAVPTFTVSRGTNPYLAVLNFPQDARASYQVRVYFENDNYLTPYVVSTNYTPGMQVTDVSSPANNATCANSIGVASPGRVYAVQGLWMDYCNQVVAYRMTVRFSLVVTNISTSDVLPESPKSNPVGFLQKSSGVLSYSNMTGNISGLALQTSSPRGVSKFVMAIRRSDDYSRIISYSASIPLNASSPRATLPLEGGYSYKFDAIYTGGVSNGITWFNSEPLEMFNGNPFYIQRKPGAITDISATPNADGGISVSWTPPTSGPTPLVYSFFVTTDKVNLQNVMNYYVYAPANSITLPGLRDGQQHLQPFVLGTQYYIAMSVSSVSPDGGAQFFSATPVTAQMAPTSPATSSFGAADSSITATWSGPSFLGGVPVKRYEMQASPDGTTWISANFDGSSSSGSVQGLTNGVAYSVRLRAVNDAGASSWLTETLTPVGIPTPVTEAVQEISATTAKIKMTLNTRGDNARVWLQYKLGDGAETELDLGSTNSSRYVGESTLTDLLPGRLYRVRAKAQASDGNYYYGQWRSFTTDAASPDNVVNTSTSSSITVAWDTPSYTPAVLKYQVWAELSGEVVGSGCADYVRSGTRGTCVITGLDSGKMYNIRITSQSTGGDFGNVVSQPSKTVSSTKRPQLILDKSSLLTKLYVGIADFSINSYYPSDAGLPVTAVSTTTSKCLVGNGSTISIRGTGTCSLTLNQVGNSIYGPAETKSVSLTVAATQSIAIAFNSLNSPKVGAAAVDISSYASATSGLAVSFVSKTPQVCSVDGVNVSPLATGVCEIVAYQVGNDSYLSAPEKSSMFTVIKGDQAALSITSTGGAFDQPLTLRTSGGTGTGLITYSLNSTGNTSNCVLTSSGVKATMPGDCIVRATKATDANYSQVVSQYKTLVFTKANQSITFVSIPDTLEGTVFNATVSSTSGLSVTLQSLTTGVCSVSSISISLDHAGTCRLKASQSGSTNYNAATDVTMVFESNAKAIPQTGNLTYDRTRTYYIGDTVDFGVAASVNGQQSEVPGTFTWFADTPDILQFDSQNPSRATIVGRSSAGGMVQVMYRFTPDTANSVLYNPAVGAAALQVQLTPQPLSLAVQMVNYDEPAQMLVTGILSTGQLSYGLSPVDAHMQSAMTRNSKCTVSGPVVTRSEPGTCVVRAMAGSDSRYAATDDVQEFVFAKKKQSLSITNTSVLEQLTYADRSTTIDLTTVAESSAGLTPDISTTSTACSISAGVLSIVSAGQCAIKLSQAGTSTIETVNESFFTFNIGKAPQPSVALTSTSSTFSVPLTLAASGGTGNGAVTYVVSDGAAVGCRIVNGALLSDTAGSCLVEVVKDEDTNYSSVISSPEIVVIEKSTHTLNFSLSNLPVVRVGDAPLSLASYAQLSSGQQAVFVSGSPSVCTVNGTILTVLSTGQCIIDAQYPETNNYVGVSAITRYFTVEAAAAPTTTQPSAPGTTQPSQSATSQVSVSVPRSVSLARGGSKSLIASWQAPESGATSITTYVATLSPGEKRCSVSGTTCTFTGLSATTSYSVSVVAVSATMTSSAGASSSIVPSIQIKTNGKTALRTMITAPSNGAQKWSVTGGCKIAGQMFVAATKATTCTLTLVTAKFKTTPQSTQKATVQVTK